MLGRVLEGALGSRVGEDRSCDALCEVRSDRLRELVLVLVVVQDAVGVGVDTEGEKEIPASLNVHYVPGRV